MGFESPSHWIIVVVLAALLFGGYKKLPEMSRSVGRSLRIFKTEMKGLSEDDAEREAADQAKAASVEQTAPIPPPVPVVPVAPVSPQVPPAAVPPAPVVSAAAPNLTKSPTENC